jgi:hypothetical protein
MLEWSWLPTGYISTERCRSGWGPFRRGGMTLQNWEHATVPLIEHSTQEILNNWGEEGWELVTVLQGPQGIVAYLKRPKS